MPAASAASAAAPASAAVARRRWRHQGQIANCCIAAAAVAFALVASGATLSAFGAAAWAVATSGVGRSSCGSGSSICASRAHVETAGASAPSLRRPAPPQSHRRGGRTPAVLRAEAAVGPASPGLAEPSAKEILLWLDFRARSLLPRDKVLFRGSLTLEEIPSLEEALKTLQAELVESLKKIGLETPSTIKDLVRGVLVDDWTVEKVSASMGDLGLPIYVANRTVDGFKLKDGCTFITDASMTNILGALPRPVMLLGAQAVVGVAQIHELVAEDEEAKAKMEEEMERYREGLKDPSKYIFPPSQRKDELFGLQETGKIMQGVLGPIFARALPPNSLLWARALVQRRKEEGKKASYRVGSDKDERPLAGI